MKKLIPIFSIALAMAACNQKPENNSDIATTLPVQQPMQIAAADTAGMADFRAWKVQNELTDVNEYNAKQAEANAPVQKQIIKKKAVAPVRKTTKTTSDPVQTPTTSEADKTTDAGSGKDNSATAGTGEVAKAEEKKQGISKAAKGAVIGAGGGYTIGRGMDKKDGRNLFNQ